MTVRTLNRRVRDARNRRDRGVAVIVLVAAIALLASLCAWHLVAAASSQARATAQQARDVEVTTAAEAGVAWLLGHLQGGAVDDACMPAGAGLPALADRWLRRQGDAGSWEVTAPAAPVAPDPLFGATVPRFACVRDAAAPTGWRCDCSGVATRLPAAAADVPVSAFVVGLLTMPSGDGLPAGVGIRSVGCVRGDADCSRPSRAGEAPARAVRIRLQDVPLLAALPSAVWTATGRVVLDGDSTARNGDGASAGLVVHAGAEVAAAAAARLVGQAGAPPTDLVAAGDAWLADHDLDGMALRLLGQPLGGYAARPAVRPLDCRDGACTGRLAAVLAEGSRAVVVRGDTVIDGPLDLGTPDRPVLVVVDGRATLRGPATVHGLVLARDLTVDGRPGAVAWAGAGVAAGDLTVHGRVDAWRDARTLLRLATTPSAWLPAPGTWRDLGAAVP